MLSDTESDAESIHQITINEHYAKAFAYRKEREELQKLKDKYGSDIEESDLEEDSDSEDDESEDELGEELTPAVDAAILRTLARIKRKDPSIYQAGADVFQEEHLKAGSLRLSRPSKDKSKPLTMRQAKLESALNPDSRSPSPQPITHAEEQRALRDETIAVFHNATGQENDTEDDSGDDDLLVLREKSKDELEREHEEYRDFLQREVGHDLPDLITVEPGMGSTPDPEEPRKKKRKKEKSEGVEDKKETDQEFLVNYILNRGWIDRSSQRVPTYKEITNTKGKRKSKQDSPRPVHSDSDKSDSDVQKTDDGLPEGDDSFDDLADTFESSYNFRFEEPDAAVIKSFPRNLPSLVRREDTTRKEARERRKQRKEEEIQRQKEEVRRLKGLKMKEIKAKLERIGREGGKKLEESTALQELDLEGDWDPEAHDKQMARIYDIDGDAVDEEKPHWDDDIDIGDLIPPDQEVVTRKKQKKKKNKNKNAEDVAEGGVDVDDMDAEMEPQDEEEWDGTEEMRKRKLEQYMDEIYGLEFNDIVGGKPTRFKYASVQPQKYGLTPAEILMADDTDLNQYMSVKKYAPYRKETRWDATRNERLKELKKKISERERAAGVDSPASEARPTKKRIGRKERLKKKALAQAGDGKSPAGAKVDEQGDADMSGSGIEDTQTHAAQDEEAKRKRKRRKRSVKE